MADYNYKPDGKLHTRYSELVRCTPGQISRVLAEREGARRFEGENMLDGTIRHEMLAAEALRTSKPYHGFGLDWPVSHVEHEFATEILPGVILHSRPDLVCKELAIIPDYKTVTDGVHGWEKVLAGYRSATKQRQLQLYAFQVGLHGIKIREGAFLCEIWNKQHTEILGYEIVRFPITMGDMAAVLAWARARIAVLASALEQRTMSQDIHSFPLP